MRGLFLLSGCAILALVHGAPGVALSKRQLLIDDKNCPKGAMDQLKKEFGWAEDMLKAGEHFFAKDEHWSETFFDEKRLNDDTVRKIKARIKRAAKIVDKNGPPVDFWKKNARTEDRLNEGKTRDLTMDEARNTRARVLAHELLHHKSVEPHGATHITDHTYGVSNNWLLAQGRLERKTKGGKKVKLSSSLSLTNADSYALAVTGIWVDEMLGQHNHEVHLFGPNEAPTSDEEEESGEEGSQAG